MDRGNIGLHIDCWALEGDNWSIVSIVVFFKSCSCHLIHLKSNFGVHTKEIIIHIYIIHIYYGDYQTVYIFFKL